MYSRLSRHSTARGSSTRFSLVDPNKVKAYKSLSLGISKRGGSSLVYEKEIYKGNTLSHTNA